MRGRRSSSARSRVLARGWHSSIHQWCLDVKIYKFDSFFCIDPISGLRRLLGVVATMPAAAKPFSFASRIPAWFFSSQA